MDILIAFAFLGSIALVGGEIGPAIKKDKAALQGTWRVKASVSKGERLTAEDVKDLFLIFKADAILVREGGKTQENFSYSLNPLKKTKEIDLTLKVGPQKGRVDRGIYLLDGDKLTICIQSNKDAPGRENFARPQAANYGWCRWKGRRNR